MLHRQRPHRAAQGREGIERNQRAAARTNKKSRQCGGIVLILWQHFGNYLIFVGRRVNSGNLAIAVRRIERVFNLLRRHSHRLRFVAIDIHGNLWAGDLQVADTSAKPGSALTLAVRIGAHLYRSRISGPPTSMRRDSW